MQNHLTHRAKDALKEIRSSIFPLRLTLDSLNMKDLEAVLDNIDDSLNDPYDRVTASLYVGIEATMKHLLAEAQAWQKDKGEWYVVAELNQASSSGG